MCNNPPHHPRSCCCLHLRPETNPPGDVHPQEAFPAGAFSAPLCCWEGGDFCQLCCSRRSPPPFPDAPKKPWQGWAAAKGPLCTETAESLPPAGATEEPLSPLGEEWALAVGSQSWRKPTTQAEARHLPPSHSLMGTERPSSPVPHGGHFRPHPCGLDSAQVLEKAQVSNQQGPIVSTL